MSVPNWYALALLAAAAWRTFQLLANDDILDRPRRKLLRIAKNWHPGQPANAEYREKWGVFLTCPYCAGFWLSLVWWGFWQWQPHWTLVVAVPLAVNAGLVALAKTIGTD